MKKMNKTALFLILTFVISYSLAGIYAATGGSFSNRIGFTLFGVAYMFIPTLCVLIVKKFIHKENIAHDLMVSFKLNKWFFVAWLIMPLIAFSTLGISLLFPGVAYSPEMTGMFERFENMMTPEQMEEMKKSLENLPINPVWITLGQGLLAGITINAVAAFGEELGWRGFLLKQFKGMKFMKASLIIGFIWGIWHAPLILMGHNYPQHPEIGVAMMTLLCMFLSPILVYLTLKAKSVIAAAIVHGTMNAVAGISIMMISGGNDLTAGITGIAGFITLAIFTLGLFSYDYFISKDKIFIREII
jgi:uncharacterized protein